MTEINVANDYFTCRQKDNFAIIEPLEKAQKIATIVDAKKELFTVLDIIKSNIDIKGLIILYTDKYPGYSEYKKYLHEGLDSDMHSNVGRYTVAFKSSITRFLELLRNSSIPIIAGIDCEMAPDDLGLILACDLRISTEKTFFINPNLELGLPPSTLLSFYLSRSLGPSKATEILLTKSKLSSHEALDLGLISEIVSVEELEGVCLKKLSKLSTIPSQALIATRRILQPSLDEISKHLDTGLEGVLNTIYNIRSSR
jgi:enoyl-CoA hydratase/carnithine racemase